LSFSKKRGAIIFYEKLETLESDGERKRYGCQCCCVVAFYEWLIVFAAAAALHLDFGWRERERGSQGIY
jgi:hypothetical protein